MKLMLIISIIINLALAALFAKIYFNPPESAPPSFYWKTNPGWWHKAQLFDSLPRTVNDIIFLGNSITEGCPWNEVFQNGQIKNRGIGGDEVGGVLSRLASVTRVPPKKIFLLIGINDIFHKFSIDSITRAYGQLLDSIKTKCPTTKVYCQSILPSREMYKNTIRMVNDSIMKMAEQRGFVYLNIHSSFADSSGQLKKEYSLDETHLNASGYIVWAKLIEQHVQEGSSYRMQNDLLFKE